MKFTSSGSLLTLTSVLLLLLTTHRSVAQVPLSPDPAPKEEPDAEEVPFMVQNGPIVTIPTPEFEKWVKDNVNNFKPFNDAINTFAEIRSTICPLGINPDQKQTIIHIAPKGFKKVPPNSLGYLIYSLKGMLTHLGSYDFTQTQGIPKWLEELSALLKLTHAQTKATMLFRLERLGAFYFIFREQWEGLNNLNAQLDDTLGTLPKLRPFERSGAQQKLRTLKLAEGLFGSATESDDGMVVNLDTIKQLASTWNKRSAELNAKVQEAAILAGWAKKWEMNTPLMSRMMNYPKYFPSTWSTKYTTVMEWFNAVWAWYGCWAGGWEDIVKAARSFTPLPGLEEEDIEELNVPLDQPSTVRDTYTIEELESNHLIDPHLAWLYVRDAVTGGDDTTVEFQPVSEHVAEQGQGEGVLGAGVAETEETGMVERAEGVKKIEKTEMEEEDI
ncbi:hypothetical protein TWF281_010329 [Arthrobotrys megalospora]